MIHGAIQNIDYYTRHRQATQNTEYNKFYKQIDNKNVSLNSVPTLKVPCDAQYLIKHNNNNINFKSSYELKTLTPKEFDKIRSTVTKKLDKFGIKFRWNERDNLLKREGLNCDIVIQSMNILLNHKIIELESVKNLFSSIMDTIQRNVMSYPNAKKLFSFADFITQEENKQVYENESVKDNMGRILLFMADDPSSIEYKEKLVKYLCEHNEILSENVDIGAALDIVNSENYSKVKRDLENHSTLSEHKDTENDKPRGPFDELFGPKKKEPLGKIVPKRQQGDGKGFDRVGGQREAINELEDLVILPRLCPDLYAGYTTVKGAVLYGQEGTGKSLMARALSEELGWYFVSISAGDRKSKYVGGTEENWNNLFKELKENQPALLFIDEIDALAKNRDTSDNYTRQELDHFLKLVSDIEAQNLDVFILVATNRLQDLDKAFLRDGRFGKQIAMLPAQTTQDVDEIFNIHIKGKKIDIDDINKNREPLYNIMLSLSYTGANIKYAVLNALTAALVRTGIREKVKAGTVTQEDIEKFNIKTVDFLTAIKENSNSVNVNESKKPGNSIPPIYLTKKSKANTVAILGSSKTTDDISKYMDMCSDFVRDWVSSGKNIVTGCGNSGIMGAAYNAAKEFSAKDELGRPKQNLAILINPLYGDEDLGNCIPLTVAKSQAERIEIFPQVADTIIVFPGSVTTLQEATALIAKNHFGRYENKKKIILVGKDFFKGIEKQYNDLYKNGLIKCEPKELFTIVDSENEIISNLI